MISRQDAAEMLRVDPQTVSNWIEKGVLTGRLIGRVVMVDSDTVNKVFDSLEDLARTEKAIKDLQAENYEKARMFKMAVDEWQQDIATVNGLERPSRLVRMITSMIENVNTEMMGERERVILQKYLDCYDFEAIGDEFGLTRERVRQIIEKAINVPRTSALTTSTWKIS